MNFLFGRPKNEARDEAVRQLLASYPSMKQNAEDKDLFELIAPYGASFVTVQLRIPHNYPVARPSITIFGAISHPWLDYTKKVTGHPQLENWEMSHDIVQIFREVFQEVLNPSRATQPAPQPGGLLDLSGGRVQYRQAPSMSQGQQNQTPSHHHHTSSGSYRGTGSGLNPPPSASEQSTGSPGLNGHKRYSETSYHAPRWQTAHLGGSGTSSTSSRSVYEVAMNQNQVNPVSLSQRNLSSSQSTPFPSSQYQPQPQPHHQPQSQSLPQYQTYSSYASVNPVPSYQHQEQHRQEPRQRPDLQRSTSSGEESHIFLPPVPDRFEEIDSLSDRDLERLLSNKEEQEAFFETLGCVENVQDMVDEMQNAQVETARRLLEKREELRAKDAELRNQQVRLRSLRSQYQDMLGRAQGSLGFSVSEAYSRDRLEAVATLLYSELVELERSGEAFLEDATEGNLPVDDFVRLYQEKRRHYHDIAIRHHKLREGEI